MAEASQTNPAASEPVTASGLAPQTRFAIKTALSLTLAYLLPMAMGWPQPQTAATTVMLIAATGMVSESLQKGVLRVLGTVAGAVIGLSLIALFPQDRMLYLFVVSMTVAFVMYLYGVYQGDSTVFMLTAVVTLMVFNGGDAEGAFIYGIDRAFMTAFGVAVYTLVASMLWPVRVADNTRNLAQAAGTTLRTTVNQLTSGTSEVEDKTLAEMLAAQEAFQNHFAAVRQDAEGVKHYLAEWNVVSNSLTRIEAALLPLVRANTDSRIEYRRFISNYDALVENIDTLFRAVASGWSGHDRATTVAAVTTDFNSDNLAKLSHRDIADVAARADCLTDIQVNLQKILMAVNSIVFDQPGFRAEAASEGKPNFLWLDREALFTGVRAFVTFWVACSIWIAFNPPGGFMFVTLCTILIPLVSYTPVTPKLLIILFSFGFIFALPAYVFLLPGMTHWLELAVFLFTYAFVGFYVFKGPVSIFFLLGLFTLGIQNQMNYNFAVIMSIMLMFYMVCAMLIISVNFPFTSNRARLYAGLRKRFFTNCAHIAENLATASPASQWLVGQRLNIGDALVTKMRGWGAMIDPSHYDRNSAEAIADFTASCDVLQGQLRAVHRRRTSAKGNRMVERADKQTDSHMLSALCRVMGDDDKGDIHNRFEFAASEMQVAKEKLDHLLQQTDMERYSHKELADFYVFLNLYTSMYRNLAACRDSATALDWQQLREQKF
ncbi:MAG: FUSC family protein [Halieaceae bacterium]